MRQEVAWYQDLFITNKKKAQQSWKYMKSELEGNKNADRSQKLTRTRMEQKVVTARI